MRFETIFMFFFASETKNLAEKLLFFNWPVILITSCLKPNQGVNFTNENILRP